jgi:hypothetical protein
MGLDRSEKLKSEYLEAKGACDILDILREEMAQWLEEARDETEREALENVLGHLEVLADEYQHRRQRLSEQLPG